VLFALVLPMVLLAGAFAVDEGSLYLERRQAQSVADLAAIAAATDPSKALDTAFKTFQANGLIGSDAQHRRPIDPGALDLQPVQVVVGQLQGGA
jgi:uncharacterized membrane protein